MKNLAFLSLLFSFIFLYSCESAQDNSLTEEHKASIASLYDKIMDTWNSGDRSFYVDVHENSQFMLPNSNTMTSRAEIQAFVDVFPPGVANFSLDQIIGSTSCAVVQGRYQMDDPDGSLLDRGKFIGAFEMTDAGEWSMTHAIWNTSQPLPASTESEE